MLSTTPSDINFFGMSLVHKNNLIISHTKTLRLRIEIYTQAEMIMEPPLFKIRIVRSLDCFNFELNTNDNASTDVIFQSHLLSVEYHNS